MSQENVEIVRRGLVGFFEGMNESNFPEVVAAAFDAGVLAPGATLRTSQEASGSKTYGGRDGFIDWAQTWSEDFVDFRFRLEKIIDAGDDRVVVLVRQSARGRGSGAPVELPFGIVFTLNSGQIIGQRNYIDPAEALKAVGLEE